MPPKAASGWGVALRWPSGPALKTITPPGSLRSPPSPSRGGMFLASRRCETDQGSTLRCMAQTPIFEGKMTIVIRSHR
jgi:hypothetical protein